MPALSGQVISTLRDGNGTPIITVTWFFDPVTLNLRNSTSSWTSPSGKVYPSGSCLIADNGTGRTVALVITNPGTGTTRVLSVPANDRIYTTAQLAAIPAPNGPITTNNHLNGLSFDLS